MGDHRRILQKRIQIAAVRWDGKQSFERVRSQQHEKQKSDTDRCHHAENPRDHLVGKVIAEQRHRNHPNRQHKSPEQQRSFVRTPSCRQPILQRKLRIGIRCHVQHGKVVVDE